MSSEMNIQDIVFMNTECVTLELLDYIRYRSWIIFHIEFIILTSWPINMH